MMMMMMMMMSSEFFAVCLLSDWGSAQKRTVPFFAWSLLESVGLTDVQLQPDSKGRTERLRLSGCTSLMENRFLFTENLSGKISKATRTLLSRVTHVEADVPPTWRLHCMFLSYISPVAVNMSQVILSHLTPSTWILTKTNHHGNICRMNKQARIIKNSS